ncbi:MAG: thermonuclease family protein [Armatimonadetes bacterium]|nr:thermonuclease family protein [Armatimonadota bacterium]
MLMAVMMLLTLAGAAESQQPFVGVLASTTMDGKLMLTTGQNLEHGTVAVDLAGVNIPPAAFKPLQEYCEKVLGGRQLLVEVTEVHEEAPGFRSCTGTVQFTAGSKKVNFNKQLLVDGYATMDRERPVDPSWERYEDKGRERRVGLWSNGKPRWVIPNIQRNLPKATAQGTDRDRIISMYGMPDFTRTDNGRDIHSPRSYPIEIKDFYLQEGLVFIYRDGRLVNQQPYAER